MNYIIFFFTPLAYAIRVLCLAKYVYFGKQKEFPLLTKFEYQAYLTSYFS